MQSQLDCIYFLQQFRTTSLDNLIQLFDYFDKLPFFLLLGLIIGFFYGLKPMGQFFTVALISALVNFYVKKIFMMPRPFHLDPEVAIIQVIGYGFPSGCAQSSALFTTLLIATIRKKWAWIVGGIYFFLPPLARVYLGIHFPLDIIGGWSLGFVLALFYLRLLQKEDASLMKKVKS